MKLVVAALGWLCVVSHVLGQTTMAGPYPGCPTAAAMPARCKCNVAKPTTHIVVIDVSKSIAESEIWTKYVPALKYIGCGHVLGVNANKQNGQDAIGVFTVGQTVKQIVDLKRWSYQNWFNNVEEITPTKPGMEWWGQRCCTPIASTLDLIRFQVKDAVANDDILGPDFSNYKLTILTDGHPMQNRWTDLPDKWTYWTQERYFPSKYKLQLVPEILRDLKLKYNMKVRVGLLPNQDGLSQSDALDYWRGINQVAEQSFKRRRFKKAKIPSGPTRTFGPRFMPMVAAPTDAIPLSGNTALDVAKAVINLACPTADNEQESTTADLFCNAAPTKLPTPSPTPKPTTPSPTLKPTTAAPTTPGPTAVVECGAEKDLIFVLDASNSIADAVDGNDFSTKILEITRQLARINGSSKTDQRTAIITFSRHVVTRLPLGVYSHAQIDAAIDDLKVESKDILGCCTSLAEAMIATKNALDGRGNPSVVRPHVVITITDGSPFLNKSPYEEAEEAGVIPAASSQVPQFRRNGECATFPINAAKYPGAVCREGTYANYYSEYVFEKNQELVTAHPEVIPFLIGVPHKPSEPGPNINADYFIGNQRGTKCKSSAGTPTDCSGSCSKTCRTNPGGFPWPADCHVVQAINGLTDRAGCAFNTLSSYYPAICPAANAVAIDNADFDVDKVVERIKTLVCNASP